MFALIIFGVTPVPVRGVRQQTCVNL